MSSRRQHAADSSDACLRGQQDAVVYSAANGTSIDVDDSRIFADSPLSSACIAGGVGGRGGRSTGAQTIAAVDSQSYGNYDMYGLWAHDGGEIPTTTARSGFMPRTALRSR